MVSSIFFPFSGFRKRGKRGTRAGAGPCLVLGSRLAGLDTSCRFHFFQRGFLPFFFGPTLFALQGSPRPPPPPPGPTSSTLCFLFPLRGGSGTPCTCDSISRRQLPHVCSSHLFFPPFPPLPVVCVFFLLFSPPPQKHVGLEYDQGFPRSDDPSFCPIFPPFLLGFGWSVFFSA